MVTSTSVVLLVLVATALGTILYYDGWRRWRALTEGRFLYGIPWGTLLVVASVVAFYLFAQGGLVHWSDPLTLPFVSWSYFYPLGVLTSGFAHGSPAHLISNMTGALAFGVVAEYTWGHYPPIRRDGDSLLAGRGGWLSRPWVRALVVVPAAMFGVALLTAVFSLGPALGFSGAVFAIAGFAVATRPLSALVALVVSRALGTLYEGLANPVVRATTEAGPPGPPSWAGIAFQAHLFGFVVGAVLGVGLLWSRRRRLSHVRVFAGTLLFGLALSLWLVALAVGEDTYVLYRGIGVGLVVVLTSLVTVAAAGSDRPFPQPIAGLWLLVLALPTALSVLGVAVSLSGVVPNFQGRFLTTAAAFVLVALLALSLPALPAVFGDRDSRFATHRGAALLGLCTIGVLLVLPGILYSPVVVDAGSIVDTGEVEVGDYRVTYGENVTSDRTSVLLDFDYESLSEETYDGLIVVSERRQLWTVAEDPANVAYDGNGTTRIGGIGWRETVRAQRQGWDVTGNDSAYVVDLTVDGETTRSFTSDAVRADVRIDDQRISVVPTEDDFEMRVVRDGSTIGTAAIPTDNETVTVGSLQVGIDRDDGATELVVESDGSRVTVAEKETY
ncbi:MAG: rhomboid family intramembrane serine protease [Halapricum sp.]